jgi:hypothetical protein
MSNIDHIQVVNVKKKFLNERGIANFEEWKRQPHVLYIGRNMSFCVPGTHGSKWSNPFKVKNNTNNREECIKLYENYIRETPDLWNSLEELLKYNELGCWCKPESCHGDALIRLLREKIETKPVEEEKSEASEKSEYERKKRLIEKKLRQINELKKFQQEGHTLEQTQLEKIKKENILLKELENLQ